jgi:hypothetical protein
VVTARYYYRQTLDVLIDTLLRAVTIHGSPLELYVDNAKVYHSNGLKAACYRTNIRLRFRKPRDPEGGGLIERFFLTTQNRFETEVRAGEILSLDALNRSFSAWLAVDYHETVHNEIKITPKTALEKGLRVVRQVDLTAFTESFMQRVERTVNKTFSDIQLKNLYYKVDPGLRGDRVLVRYDPFSQRETVAIYSLKEVYLGEGELHNRTTAAPHKPPDVPAKPETSYLSLLERQHKQMLDSKTQGIDYRKTPCHRPWPFYEFAGLTADLLGRKGGLGAFNTDELERLNKTWNIHAGLTKAMVRKACASAQSKSVHCVIHEIKLLIKQQGD